MFVLEVDILVMISVLNIQTPKSSQSMETTWSSTVTVNQPERRKDFQFSLQGVFRKHKAVICYLL